MSAFRLLVVSLALVGALVVPAQAELPAKAQAAMNQGILAAQKKDYALAIRHFEAARAVAPQAPEILLNLALAESKIPGRELRAMAWFGAYLAAHPYAEKARAITAELAGFSEFAIGAPKVRPLKFEEIEKTPGVDELRTALAAIIAFDWDTALRFFQSAQAWDPTNPALRQAVELARWTMQQQQRVDKALDGVSEDSTAMMVHERNLVPLFTTLLELLQTDSWGGFREEPGKYSDHLDGKLNSLVEKAHRTLAKYYANEAGSHFKIGDLPTAMTLLDLADGFSPDDARYALASEKIRAWLTQRELLPDAKAVRAQIAVLQRRNADNLARLIELYRQTARRVRPNDRCVDLAAFLLWYNWGNGERAYESFRSMPASCPIDGGHSTYTPEYMEEWLLSWRLANGDFASARQQTTAMGNRRQWAEVEIEMALARHHANGGNFADAYKAIDAAVARYPGARAQIREHVAAIGKIKAQLLGEPFNRAEPYYCRWNCSDVAEWAEILTKFRFVGVGDYLTKNVAGNDANLVSLKKALDSIIMLSTGIDKMVAWQAGPNSREYLEAAKTLRAYVRDNPQAWGAYEQKYKNF